MCHHKRSKHVTKRFVKKCSRIFITQDPTFRGSLVYTYYKNDEVYFTAKPKQIGSKVYPLKYVCWMKENNHIICRSKL